MKEFYSIRLVSNLLGKLTSSFQAIEYGKVHYCDLERLKTKALKINKGNFDKKTSIDSHCKQDIVWWKNNILRSLNTLHKKPCFRNPGILWKAQKDQVNIIFLSSLCSKKDRIFYLQKVQNENFSVISKYHLSINFLPKKRPYFSPPKSSKQYHLSISEAKLRNTLFFEFTA